VLHGLSRKVSTSSPDSYHTCSLLSYTISWIAAVEFHKVIIIIMLKYYVVFTNKMHPMSQSVIVYY